MDTTKQPAHVSLCSGYGGLDLGLKRAVPSLRTVAYSEIEAYACANLVAKMEAGLMDPAPVWTDVKTFPFAAFHGAVDILSGGYPCQPFSHTGLRRGTSDPRHLWPFIAGGIRAMRPRLCFFENVEGHISLGLREVLAELEADGYQTAWGIFSAAEVGGWHERKRVFILAADTTGGRVQGGWPDWQPRMVPLGAQVLSDALSALPPPCLEKHRVRFTGDCINLYGDGETAYCPECRTDFAECACVGPSMDDDFDYQENPAGELAAHTKPDISGDNDGPATWVDRMRLLGNGVVPAVAQLAFVTLHHELTTRHPHPRD